VPLVVYSVLRLGLFAACTALLVFLAGMETWFAALISVFAAWGLSYVLLGGPRDAAARYLADQAQARATRKGLSAHQREDADVEDAAQDAAEHDGIEHDGIEHDGIEHDGIEHDASRHDAIGHDEP
jgi:hypothetical protein